MRDSLRILVATAMVVAGCTPAQVQTATADQAKVAALCNTAMSLAPIAGPYGVWITAACSTEEIVADLALQPGAIAYLNNLIAKVRQEPTPLLPR